MSLRISQSDCADREASGRFQTTRLLRESVGTIKRRWIVRMKLSYRQLAVLRLGFEVHANLLSRAVLSRRFALQQLYCNAGQSQWFSLTSPPRFGDIKQTLLVRHVVVKCILARRTAICISASALLIGVLLWLQAA